MNFLFSTWFTRILRSVLVLLSACCREEYRKLDFSVPRSCRQRQLHALGWFAGVDALRAMFLSFVLRPRS